MGCPQACEDRGLPVSRALAGAAMRHAYQTPRNGFESGEALDADDVRRLVEVTADALANDRGPAMETVRMQVGTWHAGNSLGGLYVIFRLKLRFVR